MAVQMMHKPRCPVVGTGRDGYEQYCGREVARWHGPQMRCKRHTKPTDREVTAYELVQYDRAERLRSARHAADRADHALDTLIRHREAVMATFQTPVLSETVEDKRYEVIRSVKVAYVGPEHEDRQVSATVATYPGTTRSPQIKSMPRMDAWTVRDGGAYPEAVAMLMSWVAQAMESARADQAAAMLAAIAKCEDEKVAADANLEQVEKEVE